MRKREKRVKRRDAARRYIARKRANGEREISYFLPEDILQKLKALNYPQGRSVSAFLRALAIDSISATTAPRFTETPATYGHPKQ